MEVSAPVSAPPNTQTLPRACCAFDSVFECLQIAAAHGRWARWARSAKVSSGLEGAGDILRAFVPLRIREAAWAGSSRASSVRAGESSR
eukprot:222405-Prymnesium_polylepis.1